MTAPDPRQEEFNRRAVNVISVVTVVVVLAVLLAAVLSGDSESSSCLLLVAGAQSCPPCSPATFARRHHSAAGAAGSGLAAMAGPSVDVRRLQGSQPAVVVGYPLACSTHPGDATRLGRDETRGGNGALRSGPAGSSSSGRRAPRPGEASCPPAAPLGSGSRASGVHTCQPHGAPFGGRHVLQVMDAASERPHLT